MGYIYYLYIPKFLFFSPKKGLYLGGLISKGAYNRRDLYISNLVGLYKGLSVTERENGTVFSFILYLARNLCNASSRNHKIIV